MVPTKNSSAMEEGSSLSDLHEVPRAPSFSTLFYPHSQHLPHHPLPPPPMPTEQILHATQTKDGSPTRSRNGYTHTPPLEKQSASFQVQPQSQGQVQVQPQQHFVFAAPILPQIATAPPAQPSSTAQLSIKTAKVSQKKQKEAPFERFVSQWRCSTVSKDANLKWSSFAPHSTKGRNRGVHISNEDLPKTVPRLRQPLPRSQIQFQQQRPKTSSETSDKDPAFPSASSFPPSSLSPSPSSSPRTALGANTPNLSLTNESGREGESTFGLAFHNTPSNAQNAKPLGDVFFNPQTGKWVTKENPAGFVFENLEEGEETEEREKQDGGEKEGENDDGMENNTSTRPLRTSSSPVCPSTTNPDTDTETALAAMKRRASSPANSSGHQQAQQQQQQQTQMHTFWKFQQHAFPASASPLSNAVSFPMNNAPNHPEVRPSTPLSESSGPSPRSSSNTSFSAGDVDLTFMPESFSFAPSPAAHRPSPTSFTQMHPHSHTPLNETEASRNLHSNESGSHRMALDSNIAPSFPSRSPSPSPSSITFSTSSLAPSHPVQSFYHTQMSFGNQTMTHASLHTQSQQLNIPLAYPPSHLPPGHPFSSLTLPTTSSQPLAHQIAYNGMSMHFPDRQDSESSSNTTTSFVPVQHSTPTAPSQPMSFTQHLSNHIQSMQQTDLQREPDFSQFQAQPSNNTPFGRPRSASGAREMQYSFNHTEEGDEKMSERSNGSSSSSSTSTLEYIPLPLFEAVPPRSASLAMIDHNTMSDLSFQFAPGSPSSLLMMGHQPMLPMTTSQSRPMMGPSPTPSPSSTFITSPIHSAGPLWTLTSPPLQVAAPPVTWHVPFEYQTQDPRDGQAVLFSILPDGSATPTAFTHQFVGQQIPSHSLIPTSIPPSFPYFLHQQQQQSSQIPLQQQQQQTQMHPHLTQSSQQQQQQMMQQQMAMQQQQQQEQAPVTLEQGEHLQYFVPFSNSANTMHLR